MKGKRNKYYSQHFGRGGGLTYDIYLKCISDYLPIDLSSFFTPVTADSVISPSLSLSVTSLLTDFCKYFLW